MTSFIDTANLRIPAGTVIIATEKDSIGNVRENWYTVKRLVKVYTETTPRYRGDSNPSPAGTIVCDLNGGGMHRRSFRPGTYTIR